MAIRDISTIFPTSKKELELTAWGQPDIIIISGDAFIDHPSFGPAVIARVLTDAGYKVAVIPQPNWRDDLRDFKKLGKPRLFFAVTAGNIDSMLNHYTANKRKRSDDAYTPDGRAGMRPDYATDVYSNILKQLYPDTPIIIGGIEASMRRFIHYDYWSDKLKSSILETSRADILIYGMAEKSIVKVANTIAETYDLTNCYNIPQIAYLTEGYNKANNDINLFGYQSVVKDKLKHGKNFIKIETESNYPTQNRLIQKQISDYLIVNPPYPTLTSQEIDKIYDLPYTRKPHPRYKASIPAFEMIKNSVTIHRGCFGACSFCTIATHQGKLISSRSEKSILNELNIISSDNDFKGHITDIGGPSANMYKMHGKDENICNTCKKVSCIYPSICNNLNYSHEPLLDLYDQASKIQNIKHITIGSGVRYDMALHKSKDEKLNKINKKYIEVLISNFVSGRLKVAPEHTSDKVLKLIRKTSFDTFKQFQKEFNRINKEQKLNQQLVPYFISSHPASTESDMAELAAETKDLGFKLEQVQAFTPTPMTLATVMYYTGVDPYSGNKIYVAKSREQRENQQSFFFWHKPEKKQEIINNLNRINRKDLINKLYGKVNFQKKTK